ncbi:MAG: hypothetical protein PQ612_02995 [Rickettsiales bacterium]|nr:hypothetical protein [Pseudomonadota bacterium]MDA0965921.1 hypothetical protein [Pseudomonadota bacterium]MDG4542609.1 hypothetical protein [Rickettsiales bacterium]MDG4545113.1 hypothetical protein [Rickettsiales bacterium]
MQRINNDDKKTLDGILTRLQDDAPNLFDYEAVGLFQQALSSSAEEEVDLDISLNKYGESLLHIAATSDRKTKDDIDFLISKAGFSPDRRNNLGFTPLDNALEAYATELENTDKDKKDKVEHSVADTLIARSSLETLKKPSNENNTVFHILSEIPSADPKLYKTAMDRLEGVSEEERIGILNSNNPKNQTILDRLMLQDNTEAIDIIYSSLSDKEKPEFLIKGVNSELFGNFNEDTYKFYIEKYKQAADYQVRYSEIPTKDTKVTFEPEEAKALANVLQRSLEPNKNNPNYGSEEKVRTLISELRQTDSLHDGVNQTLGHEISGTTLLNLTIGMHDKKSFDILSKYGADFNNRELNQAKVLPIELAIDAHARSRLGSDRQKYKKDSKAILEETIAKSTPDSLINPRVALDTNPTQYSNGAVIYRPQFIFTGSALNLVAEQEKDSVLPEFVTKIIDKVNESGKIKRIAEFIALVDFERNSPLHSAAANGSKDILREILNYKDLTPSDKVSLMLQPNKNAETPVDKASNNPEILKFFEQQLKINKRLLEKEPVAKVAHKNEESNEKHSKKKKKNPKHKSSLKQVVENKEPEISVPVFAVTTEPDLEDLVAQVYNLFKKTDKDKFPKKEFDRQKENIRKYIIEKEDGNFQALDEALDEEHIYGGKSYRDKIKEELGKFSDKKKAQKASDWADGKSGRPDPSLKKEALDEPDFVQSAATSTEKEFSDYTPQQSKDTDDKSLASANNTDISVRFDSLSIQSEEKRPASLREESQPAQKEDFEKKVPFIEVSVDTEKKDSMSTLTPQQYDAQQENEKKFVVNTQRSAFKAITPAQNINDIPDTAYAETIEQSPPQPQYYAPANDGYASNFPLPQIPNPQQQYVAYPQAAYGAYYQEQPQQAYGYVPPDGYYTQPQQMGFVTAQYPLDAYMQTQMPPQYAFPQQAYYQEAAPQDNGYYGYNEQQYYQQQYVQFNPYPAEYATMPAAYTPPQPPVIDNATRIAELQANRIAMQKAQAAIDEEINRISGDSRSSGSVRQIVREGAKSAVEHVEKRTFTRGRT